MIYERNGLSVKIFQQGMARQMLSVLVSHMVFVLIVSVFMFMLVASVMDKPVLYMAVSVLMSVMYFFGLYAKGKEIAGRDKLSYTTTSTYLFKGSVLSLSVLVWNFVLWLLYVYAWKFLTLNGQLFSFSGIFYNIIYVFNTFMFSGFAEISGGKVEWYAHLLIYLVPLAAVTIGYIAGVYDFSVMEKVAPFVYEKKKK